MHVCGRKASEAALVLLLLLLCIMILWYMFAMSFLQNILSDVYRLFTKYYDSWILQLLATWKMTSKNYFTCYKFMF